MIHRKPFLAFECAVLFLGIPGVLIYFQLQGGIHFFETLFGMFFFTLLLGYLDPSVRFRVKGSWRRAVPLLPGILLRALLSGVLLLVAVRLIWPEQFLSLLRERPRLWLAIMILYPLLSVAPQEYLFRIYFMQRYRPLFGDGKRMIAVNALIFGWAHAFMLNPIAPILSVIAGWFFAETWHRSRNLRAVWLEHALYGQIVFTVGLGTFFYNASAQALQNAAP
ncbi:MAG: CPBP family intramembrane metalloprotease [Verrucomicrobia bacterium]|nr:CPBP family intramembrane metalloprotease [Verrucomicrobiota bacterium]MCH8512151.1 CPBP family intramembrane metalloprotease [Kiritimatiellia bacterium]